MARDNSSLFCDDTIQRHTEQQCSRHHRLPHRAGGRVLYFVEKMDSEVIIVKWKCGLLKIIKSKIKNQKSK